MKKLFQLLWFYAKGRRAILLLVVFMETLGNIIASMQPVVLDHLIQGLKDGGLVAVHNTLFWCGVMASISLFFWSMNGPARVMERRLAFVVYRRFVMDLYGKISALPLQWHQAHHSGDTINRATKAGRALFDFSQDIYIFNDLVVGAGAALCLMVWYSWWVALTIVVVCSLVMFIVKKLDKKLVALVDQSNKAEHRLTAALYDYIGNIASVLTLRLQGRTAREIDSRFGGMRSPFWEETVYNEKKWFALNCSMFMVRVGVVGLYIGVTLLSGKEVAIGSVVAIFQIQSLLSNAFNGMTHFGNTLLHRATDVAAADIFEEAFAQSHGALPTEETEKTWQSLQIENLSFAHEAGGEAQVKDVSFAIAPGEKIALVGTSGAGKTTLLTLLRGLYTPESVRVMHDGLACEGMSSLASISTLVPQDAEIFENTIRYNVTMGVTRSDEELQKALHAADFDIVAAGLPKGLETDIRERGVNLSGGQKQRLALARGLLASHDSSLLLLDEPTSHVDLMTEGAIFDRLFTLYGDKAMIVSIHRLNTLPRFDKILMMDRGRLVQQGSFTELLAQPGPFLALWERYLAGAQSDSLDL